LFELRAANDLAQLTLSCGDHVGARKLLEPYAQCFSKNTELAEKIRLEQLLSAT